MLVKALEILALDVDGVLTDGLVQLTAHGEQMKSLCFRDLDALGRARAAGLRIALVTGESGALVDSVAEHVRPDCVLAGSKDKRRALEALAERFDLPLSHVCFVGDADRDALAFDCVGLALAPADGSELARARAHRVLKNQGGRGAVAEAVDVVLALRAEAARAPERERVLERILEDSLEAHRRVFAALPVLSAFAEAIVLTLRAGGKVLFCGNGGSAADAQHVAAELIGRFAVNRAPWAAIALTTDSSILTAVGNDFGFEQVFARQVRALARPSDLVVGISTSGGSRNVVLALEAARGLGARTAAFTGHRGGAVAGAAELVFAAPSLETPRIQELHLFAWHAVCEIVEQALLDTRLMPSSAERESVRTMRPPSRRPSIPVPA